MKLTSSNYNGVAIKVKQGDLTDEECEALVNPANSLGIMGGGVAGALKAKGGACIEREAMALSPIQVGGAVATSAGKLKTRFVIHAPTMEKPAQRTTATAVGKATAAALDAALKLGVRTIAFPGMGTGVGGVSAREAAQAMASAAKTLLAQRVTRRVVQGRAACLKEIRFVAFDEKLRKAFEEAVEKTSKD